MGLRAIVEEERVRNSVDKAELIWLTGAEQSWGAVKYVLANDPEFGVAVTESGRLRQFTYQGAGSNNTPSVTVIYEFDDKCVYVIDVKFFNPGKYEQYHH